MPDTISSAKPGEDTARWYGPVGSDEKENWPLASVAARIDPLPSCDQVTVAAGIGAPVSSVTMPVMVPDANCSSAANWAAVTIALHNSITHTPKQTQRRCKAASEDFWRLTPGLMN